METMQLILARGRPLATRPGKNTICMWMGRIETLARSPIAADHSLSVLLLIILTFGMPTTSTLVKLRLCRKNPSFASVRATANQALSPDREVQTVAY